jgi:hypothetical protein
MYKMRSIDNLLGKNKELENQEIYFADLSKLNDPMEGFLEFHWNGDIIVWKNFFYHYLLCLENIVAQSQLVNDDYIFTENDIQIYMTFDKLPTQKYKDMITNIATSFFSSSTISKYLSFLSNRKTPIYRSELKSHLKGIHLIALMCILNEYKKNGFSNFSGETLLANLKFDALFNIWDKNRLEIEKDTSFINKLYEVEISIHSQLSLIQSYNIYTEKRGKIKSFLLYEFPDSFVDKIDELAYPHAYISCFMSSCDNSSLWGYYGDNHRGVCLIFKTEERNNKHFLSLTTKMGQSNSGSIIGNANFEFKKVKYSKNFPTIDFFRSLGRMPMDILYKYWYMNENGETSFFSNHLKTAKSIEKWRANYWKKYEKCLTIKLPDWKKENEYRLILEDFMDSHSAINDRKLKYHFNDLEGIIFGYKTTTENKIRIMKIIEEKCKQNNRKKFDFYQAQYIPSSGEMEIDKLDLLKIS